MQTAGHMYFLNFRRQFCKHLGNSHLVRTRAALLHSEVAEYAREHADIGRFDFLIQDKIHCVAAAVFLNKVRHLAERNYVPGLEQYFTIIKG